MECGNQEIIASWAGKAYPLTCKCLRKGLMSFLQLNTSTQQAAWHIEASNKWFLDKNELCCLSESF